MTVIETGPNAELDRPAREASTKAIERPGRLRNLFEMENARNMTAEEIAATFVPTRSFWRMLSTKNHVILGARGSGKTALTRMLSHDHLSRLRDDGAQKIVSSRELIGIYVPTRIEWVSSLRNYESEEDPDSAIAFQWKINIATCTAFLRTLASCVSCYVEDDVRKTILENKISMDLADAWGAIPNKTHTFRLLRGYLEQVEFQKHVAALQRRILGVSDNGGLEVGSVFNADLFRPLKRSIEIAARHLSLPETTRWIVAIDEAEYLNIRQQRLLNTHMRGDSSPLVFKITTMPYHHRTLETDLGVPLDTGHDFEYVYIDQDPIGRSAEEDGEISTFAGQIFSKRAAASGPQFTDLSLREFLGSSRLMDTKETEDWSHGSENLRLLRKYASKETWARAVQLLPDQKRFRDQIGRKLLGAIRLRAAVEQAHGRHELSIYSGASLVVRCGDGNPRRLIRMFNSMLIAAKRTRGRKRSIKRYERLTPTEQTRTLVQFSTSTLSRIRSEPRHGADLYGFLTTIGKYMHRSLHEEKLGTDLISSIAVDEDPTSRVWLLITQAVGLGLLFPNINMNNPDQMPIGRGLFHMGYVLAPHFRLLPRKGKSRSLPTVMSSARTLTVQRSLFDDLDG